MSATLNADEFAKYFQVVNGEGALRPVHIDGRMFKVYDYYWEDACEWLGFCPPAKGGGKKGKKGKGKKGKSDFGGDDLNEFGASESRTYEIFVKIQNDHDALSVARADREYHKSEVITPRPITPTFGYTKEKLRRTMWVRGFTTSAETSLGGVPVSSRRRDLRLPVETSRGRGVVDVHTIRVFRLRWVVWVELSPGRVCMDPFPQERVGFSHYVGGCMLSSRTWE